MRKLSNSAIISIVSKLLILLVIAKGLSLVLWWYLPSDGIEMKIKNNYQPKYQRVQFKNMIKQEVVVVEKKVVEEVVETIGITNMLLKGLYGTSTNAYVIVAMKITPKKTEIIGIGEEFKGYKLKSITPSSAIFEKDSKDYALKLEESTKKQNSKNKSIGDITRVQKKKTIVKGSDKPIGVSRKDIAYFAKNPKQIWRDISIKEVVVDGKIIGFNIRKIKRNSKFAILGLQKGDLIIKANNIRLESYKDAINIYKNINKLDTIQIVVIRDEQEVELVYDIN